MAILGLINTKSKKVLNIINMSRRKVPIKAGIKYASKNILIMTDMGKTYSKKMQTNVAMMSIVLSFQEACYNKQFG